MEWGQWVPPFTNLSCKQISDTGTAATIVCNFAVINDPATGMSNTSFWDVDLEKAAQGRWLITSYGQG